MRPKRRAIDRRRVIQRRVRPGLLLRREPRLWWTLVLATALAVGWVAASAVSDAEEARAAWGRTRAVLVADREVAAGQALRARDVRTERWPASLVPAGALRALPPRSVARTTLFAGEPVLGGRLAPGGLEGVAAMLPPGARAVAVPVEAGTAPPLGVGDRVDVLVALPAEAAGTGPPGFAVASDALVVAVDELAVTVAVDRAVAPRIAVALSQGAVSLALVGA